MARPRIYTPEEAKRRIAASRARWAAEHPELNRAVKGASYRRWVQKNREKRRALDRAHYQRVKATRGHIYNARYQGREKARLRATPPWCDFQAVLAIYERARRLSKQTGVKHHVDHEIPLRGRLVSGLHVPANLRIVPATVNLTKANRFVVEA